jgi:hypothetical protein
MTRHLRPALIALVALLLLPASAAAATTLYVNSTTGNDAYPCTSAGFPCMTIQAAINKASPGAIINVAAGTYPEPAGGPLTVDKTLTLLGAQAGMDARTRVGSESIVTDPQGTSVSASAVVIDGFTFQDSIAPAFTGFGIWLNPGISGTQILNNIIQDNIVGIGLANHDAGGGVLGPSAQARIEHNLIQNNNRAGGAAGTGIYTDQFVGGSIADNILIDENTFRRNDDAGIDVSNTDASGGVFNLDVSTNSFDGNGRAVVFFNTHDSTVHDNSITSSTSVGSAAIRLFDSNENISFLRNNLATGAGHAIRFSTILGLA